MDYNNLLNSPRSRKILLARVTSSKPSRFFTLVSGNTYTKQVDHFVKSVTVNGIAVSHTYSVATKTLTITSSLNPNTNYAVIFYTHFFSNFPVVLPNDLDSGESVSWEARIDDIGELKLELDYEQTGIAIESNSSLTLQNTDGYFDSIFDTHVFENKLVEFYYFFEELPPSEAKLIYRGIVLDKSFNSKQIKLSLKDAFYSLRDSLKINLFDIGDGSYDSSLYLKPKRRVYGEVSKLKCNSLDQLKKTFEGVGTVSGTVAVADIDGNLIQYLNGLGTNFLNDLSIGDKFIAHSITGDIETTVNDVISNTQIIVSDVLDNDLASCSYTVSDIKDYSKDFNRVWSIAGHKLAEITTEVVEVKDPATFRVTSNLYFEVGDLVEVGSIRYLVKSVYGDRIVFNQNISPLPTVGTIFYKISVKKAYLGTRELVYKRDYEINNLTSGANLVVYPNAEFNVAPTQISTGNLTFTLGSNIVNTSYDMRSVLGNRDYIKVYGPTYFNWYEILAVEETFIKLRTNALESYTGLATFKNVDYLADDSIVAVDCIGLADGTKWVRYAGEVVEHIIKNDVGVATTSSYFDTASEDAQFKLSAFWPKSIGDDSPAIRDCITEITGSVLGSLFYDTDFNFKFSILNSNKPDTIKVIQDDDIISYEVITKNNIINSGKIEFNPETDLISGDMVYNALTSSSDFVDYVVGISLDKTYTTLLANSREADIILRRHLFFNSLTTSIVKIVGKLGLSELDLNTSLELSLDRIYRRYAGKDKRKIGLVNYISKKATTVDIQINDLGGIFNRVPSIAPNSVIDIGSSSQSDIAKYGYIVDNNNETPNNDEDYYGTNLIG